MFLSSGRWTAITSIIRQRLHSDTQFLVLQCDLAKPCDPITVREPIMVRPRQPGDTASLLNLREPGITPKGVSDRLHQARLLEVGLETCYVAVVEDGRACYMTWLVGASHNAKIETYFGDSVQPLAADEMLVEGGFTLEAYRDRRIMAAAGAQIRACAAELGARRLTAYVDQANVPSLKGFRRNGYVPILMRHDRWRLFRRRVIFTPVSEEVLAGESCAAYSGFLGRWPERIRMSGSRMRYPENALFSYPWCRATAPGA